MTLMAMQVLWAGVQLTPNNFENLVHYTSQLTQATYLGHV